MRSVACIAAGWLTLSGHAGAHEFWIEPAGIRHADDTEISVQVRVGENFDGEVFPFQPRAYSAAYWIGPKGVLSLHALPLSQGDLAMSVQGDGLHTLAVASFGRSLTYASYMDFAAFAHEIGARAMLASVPHNRRPDDQIKEVYRRFSKTLVHFGTKTGADKRLGLDYEWVQTDSGFTLFSPQGKAPNHPVDLFCRTQDGPMRQQRLHTNADGGLTPDTAHAERCLLNAVFLTPPETSRIWTSDWVSVHWDP